MKKLKVILLLLSIVGLAVFTLPVFGADTADVTLTVTLGTGPPTVATVSAADITETSFTANGNISAVGGSVVTRRGFCYIVGDSGDPTTADTVAYEDGTFGVGAYSIGIAGLTLNTHYRVRAYAVNGSGTSYGAALDVITTIPDNLIIITGTGVITITGPSPFTTNISSIGVSINTTIDNVGVEVER